MPLELVDADGSSGPASTSGADDQPTPVGCADLGKCFEQAIEIAVGLGPTDVLFADVLGDGGAGIVVRGLAEGTPTRVLVALPTDGFVVDAAMPDGGQGAVVMDVDGDGKADLITAEGTSLAMWSGASRLRVQAAAWTVSRSFSTLRALEPTIDGEPRLIGEARDEGEIAVVRIIDSVVAIDPLPFGTDPEATYSSNGLDVGDVDGDGDVDFAVVVDTYINGAHLADVRVWPTPEPPYAAVWFSGEGHHQAIGDVDGDDRDDVLVLEYFGRLHRFGSTGPATIADLDGWDGAADALAVGDISGDGIADVVLARHPDHDTPRLDLLTDWDDGAPVPYSLGLDHELDVVALADVDGDGLLDIVGGSVERGTITVLTARGS